MNLERGFRRVVLAASVALVCTGLGVTAYGGYVTYRSVSDNLAILSGSKDRGAVAEACIRDTARRIVQDVDAGRLSLRDPGYDQHRDNLLARCEERLGFKRWYRVWPVPLYARLPVWATGKYTSYGLVGRPLLWGLLLTAGLGAVPWGAFYLVRWIARGFRDER